MVTDSRIGLICDPDHDVFAIVGQLLEHRGYRVDVFEPGRPIDHGVLDDLDLLANKKVAPASMDALRYAAGQRIPTWNGYLTAMLGARPIGLIVLEAAGFAVPRTTFEKPEGDYVAKSMIDWHYEDDPTINGVGDVYQRYLPGDSIDYKYYAVDDGEHRTISVLRSTSKLHGEKQFLEHVDPDPALATKLRHLLSMTDSQAIGVDIIYSDGDPYAVDVNPAMSFRNAGMEAELADSMAARAIDPQPDTEIVPGLPKHADGVGLQRASFSHD